MKKAAFLDRDGVINRKAPADHYVTRWEEMEFFPGVHEAIRRLRQAGFVVIVVTNQRCVAKGLITVADLEAMHARMRRDFAAAGAVIDAIYYCPHEKEPPCACRKPEPGMLWQAIREHDVAAGASWMIGDSAHDTEAGRAAGCSTALIVEEPARGEDDANRNANANGNGDHNGNDKISSRSGADVTASSLLDAVEKILRLEAALPSLPANTVGA